MNLAIRVRDYRYAKGWGPDELANRAEISRTALYQIESGKTGLPRAGTLQRIAMALDVTMDDLLGNGDVTGNLQAAAARPPRKDRPQWLPNEGGPLNLPANSSLGSTGFVPPNDDEHRFSVEKTSRNLNSGFDSVFLREGELMSKLHDLLHSSLGAGITRVVEDLHALLPKARSSH